MALYYLHEQETPKGSNKGACIDKWNKRFGLNAVPWCASSQSEWAELGQVIEPRINSARAKDFNVKGHTLNQILYDVYTPKCGDYRVKSRSGGNHVDVFLSWDKETKEGYVIGGNVGDEVSIRKVTLRSMIADGTKGITAVTGYYDYYLPDNEFKEWLKQFGTVKQNLITEPKIIDTLMITATWYNLHGKRTASGEIFDKTKLTAAHKSIKLGTNVIIEYKGRKIQARINDRCPKKGLLDMSPAVRDSVKFKSGKVKVYILE